MDFGVIGIGFVFGVLLSFSLIIANLDDETLAWRSMSTSDLFSAADEPLEQLLRDTRRRFYDVQNRFESTFREHNALFDRLREMKRGDLANNVDPVVRGSSADHVAGGVLVAENPFLEPLDYYDELFDSFLALSRTPEFVFVASSGRTGTQFMAGLLSSALNVRCFHERHPLLSHQYLRLPLTETYWERFFAKMGSIATDVVSMNWSPGVVYCDSSNYFIKSWFDVALDFFVALNQRAAKTNQQQIPVKIVVLRRYLPDVLKSMMDLSWFGGKGKQCGKFLYSANSNISLVEAIEKDEEMDAVDKAIGHLMDVEAKISYLKQEYGHHSFIQIVETCLEPLTSNESKERIEFLDNLGFSPSDITSFSNAWEDNSRSTKKKPPEKQMSVATALSRINQYIVHCQENNIWIPEMPHLFADFCGKKKDRKRNSRQQ